MGGGVALYINSNIYYWVREDLTYPLDSIESLFIEIKNMSSKNIVIGAIYKPPRAVQNNFMQTFHDIIANLSTENKTCILSAGEISTSTFWIMTTILLYRIFSTV